MTKARFSGGGLIVRDADREKAVPAASYLLVDPATIINSPDRSLFLGFGRTDSWPEIL